MWLPYGMDLLPGAFVVLIVSKSGMWVHLFFQCQRENDKLVSAKMAGPMLMSISFIFMLHSA